MGHRWIREGALIRHVPRLISGTSGANSKSITIPFEDELRFAYYRFGRKWAAWALFRAIITGYVALPTALRAWRTITRQAPPAKPAPLRKALANS